MIAANGIHSELAGLGVKVAASTVWEILNTDGIGSAPRRTGPTWPQFLRSQAEAILACDFFTADLLDGTQAHVLTVIKHATRRIRIVGVTLHPTGDWTAQQARHLLMDLGDQAGRVKLMIRDRGPNFTAAFAMSYCVDVSSWRAANISDDRIIWWPGTDGHPARTVWYREDSRSAGPSSRSAEDDTASRRSSIYRRCARPLGRGCA